MTTGMASKSTTTPSMSTNVLHLIHLRSQRTNRNRRIRSGANPNNRFSKSLRSRKSRACSARLLLGRLHVRAEQCQQQFNFFLGTDLYHPAHSDLLLPVFDERGRPQVHAIWLQDCFRTVSWGGRTGDLANPPTQNKSAHQGLHPHGICCYGWPAAPISASRYTMFSG